MQLNWLKYSLLLGLIGALQFLIWTSLAMYWYPGGTLHHPQLERYDFFYNFFSDLGRTYTFDRQSNTLCHTIFKCTLGFSGLTMAVFFVAQFFLFRTPKAKAFALGTMLLGITAGVCYIGIGMLAWNEDYWGHRWYVRVGFISFLGMVFMYAAAIFNEKLYPNKYAWVFLLFSLVLLMQILIMFLATNAWHSNQALFVQASAQKVVVYAEIFCMLYQSNGALKVLSKQGISG